MPYEAASYLTEGYDDKELASDLEFGFSLVGEVPRSHILPAKLLPATLSTTDLTVQSKKSNVALRYMTRSSGSSELDDKLWERTTFGSRARVACRAVGLGFT